MPARRVHLGRLPPNAQFWKSTVVREEPRWWQAPCQADVPQKWLRVGFSMENRIPRVALDGHPSRSGIDGIGIDYPSSVLAGEAWETVGKDF